MVSVRLHLAVLAAAVCLCLGAAPSAHAVTPPKRCGAVEVKGKRYSVRAHRVTCRFARRWTRRYLRSGSRPSGWRCRRYSGTSIKFICRRAGRDYYAIR